MSANQYGQTGNAISIATVSGSPEMEPLSKDEVKLHLGIEGTAEFDERIDQLIAGARAKIERTTGRRLLTQTLIIYSNYFPSGRELSLPVAPVSSISSVQYYDVDGVLQTFDSAKYYTDLVREPGRIVLADGEVWPSTQVARPNAVEVTAVAGYGDDAADVPEGITTAMLMMIEKAFDRPDENYLKALDRVQTNELSPYVLRRFG